MGYGKATWPHNSTAHGRWVVFFFNTVDDDDTKVGGDNSEEDENRATRRSTFVSSFFQCFRPPHLWLTKNKIYFFMVQRECDTLDK